MVRVRARERYTAERQGRRYRRDRSPPAGLPVGLPGLPSLRDADYEEYLGWIDEYINVPLDQFAPYTETVNTIVLTPEPVSKAQEVYAALDSVVQAVLTDQNADIDALLAAATSNVNALLAR